MTSGSSSGTLGCPTTNISSRLGEAAGGPGAGWAAEGAGRSRPIVHGFPPLAASSSCSAAALPPCASALSPPARMTCCWLAVREVAAAGMFGSISPRSRGEDAWVPGKLGPGVMGLCGPWARHSAAWAALAALFRGCSLSYHITDNNCLSPSPVTQQCDSSALAWWPHL